MDITLKQLRAFVTVANLGQFTLAADKLGSSQSAVSTLVRQLEANLNLRLFDRHTRLLRLTQAGMDILPIAARAVADIEGMVESSRELNALRRGKVTMAAGRPARRPSISPRLSSTGCGQVRPRAARCCISPRKKGRSSGFTRFS